MDGEAAGTEGEARAKRNARADRVGLAGYGCLLTLTLSGLIGGASLLLLGIRAFLAASAHEVEDSADAATFLDSLEGSVILCGSGTLAVLIGVVSLVVVFKELADDAARKRRGPV